MTMFLVSIYRPDNYDGVAVEDDQMKAAISELNRAMVDAGIRRFVGGLQSEQRAIALRRDADGEIHVDHGPYMAVGQHIGGFWVLDVPSMDDAAGWGRRAAHACRASVEVRPFH